MLYELFEYQQITNDFAIRCKGCSKYNCLCDLLSSNEFALFDVCDMAFLVEASDANKEGLFKVLNNTFSEVYICDASTIADMVERNEYNEECAKAFWASVCTVEEAQESLFVDYRELVFLYPKHYVVPIDNRKNI